MAREGDSSVTPRSRARAAAGGDNGSVPDLIRDGKAMRPYSAAAFRGVPPARIVARSSSRRLAALRSAASFTGP